MTQTDKPSPWSGQRGVVATAALSALLLVSACGDSVDLTESAVCGDGLPGDLAVAGSDEAGEKDQLVMLCWRDTTHTDPGRVAIHEAGDDGTFEQVASHQIGRQSRALAVVDLDGDNVADILAANTGGLSEEHYLSFLKGNGDGTYEEEARLPAVRSAFVVNDVNDDGRRDLVIPRDSAALLARDGEGTFRRSRLPGVETRDRNGDVVPGLSGDERFAVVPDRDAGKLHVYSEEGAGDDEVVLPDGAAFHSALAVADINSDDRPDLIVAVQGADPLERSVHVLLSQESGPWELSDRIDGITRTPNNVALAVDEETETIHAFVSPWADPDRDHEFLDRFSIGPDGETTTHGSITIPHFAYSMIVGDFQGDGIDELVIRDMDGQRITRIPMSQFEPI